MKKKRHRLSPVLGRIYILVIIGIFVIFSNSAKESDQTKNPNRPVATPTPCYKIATTVNPLDSKSASIVRDYNRNISRWPIVKRSWIIETTVHQGINIKNTDTNTFTPEDIKLVIDTINQAPQILLDYRPQSIYLATADIFVYPEDKKLSQSYDGFTKGLDIYLFPSLFKRSNKSIVSGLIFHEWGHIIQFYQLSNNSFLEDYSTIAGWKNGTLQEDIDSQKQTIYGKRMPQEDLSESVSLFLTNDSHRLSTARINWVKNFLGCY